LLILLKRWKGSEGEDEDKEDRDEDKEEEDIQGKRKTEDRRLFIYNIKA
jgi:hypothetical protein